MNENILKKGKNLIRRLNAFHYVNIVFMVLHRYHGETFLQNYCKVYINYEKNRLNGDNIKRHSNLEWYKFFFKICKILSQFSHITYTQSQKMAMTGIQKTSNHEKYVFLYINFLDSMKV